MSLFHLPRGNKFRLEKIQRYFLWGGGSLERKLHLIDWNTVCGSQESGGLEIRDLTLMNKALLGKWTWKFAMKGDTIWLKLISLKYGREEGTGFRELLEEIMKQGYGRPTTKKLPK